MAKPFVSALTICEINSKEVNVMNNTISFIYSHVYDCYVIVADIKKLIYD